MRNTYINFDTNWLSTKIGAQYLERSLALANEAARFSKASGLSPVTARKLTLLQRQLTSGAA